MDQTTCDCLKDPPTPQAVSSHVCACDCVQRLEYRLTNFEQSLCRGNMCIRYTIQDIEVENEEKPAAGEDMNLLEGKGREEKEIPKIFMDMIDDTTRKLKKSLKNLIENLFLCGLVKGDFIIEKRERPSASALTSISPVVKEDRQIMPPRSNTFKSSNAVEDPNSLSSGPPQSMIKECVENELESMIKELNDSYTFGINYITICRNLSLQKREHLDKLNKRINKNYHVCVIRQVMMSLKNIICEILKHLQCVVRATVGKEKEKDSSQSLRVYYVNVIEGAVMRLQTCLKNLFHDLIEGGNTVIPPSPPEKEQERPITLHPNIYKWFIKNGLDSIIYILQDYKIDHIDHIESWIIKSIMTNVKTLFCNLLKRLQNILVLNDSYLTTNSVPVEIDIGDDNEDVLHMSDLKCNIKAMILRQGMIQLMRTKRGKERELNAKFLERELDTKFRPKFSVARKNMEEKEDVEEGILFNEEIRAMLNYIRKDHLPFVDVLAAVSVYQESINKSMSQILENKVRTTQEKDPEILAAVFVFLVDLSGCCLYNPPHTKPPIEFWQEKDCEKLTWKEIKRENIFPPNILYLFQNCKTANDDDD